MANRRLAPFSLLVKMAHILRAVLALLWSFLFLLVYVITEQKVLGEPRCLRSKGWQGRAGQGCVWQRVLGYSEKGMTHLGNQRGLWNQARSLGSGPAQPSSWTGKV